MKLTAKNLLALGIVFLTFISCNKNDVPSGNNGGYTTEKSPTPVNSRLMAYMYDHDQAAYPAYLTFRYEPFNGTALEYKDIFGGFQSNESITADRYRSYVEYNTTLTLYNLGFVQLKAFTASSHTKNYIGVKFQNFTGLGIVRNLGGPVSFNLPGGGSLNFPSNVFSQLGEDMNFGIYVNSCYPNVKDFALNLPSLPFADVKGERYFLDSYGVIQIHRLLSYCNCEIIRMTDIFAKEVSLALPISPDYQASAPDSIEAWHLNADLRIWEQIGFAYKKNGSYEKNIRQHGVWNFAKPSDAVYLTLQLRTTNGMPLPNTRFLIRDKQNEIAEGRSDAEGNALIFVPAKRSLTFKLINDHNYYNIPATELPIGSFSSETSKKVVLPDRPDVTTLEGMVYNCDGSSFGNGSVVVSQIRAKDDYVFPIINGKFEMATWLSVYTGTSKLSFRDPNGAVAFEVNTFLGSETIQPLKRLRHNFYACPNASQLFCKYQIDNSAGIITADLSQSSPQLLAIAKPGYMEIKIQDGNKGFSFPMWILDMPVGVISGHQPLVVNNATCEVIPDGEAELTIYRDDHVVGGFMEGWFSIDYLDANKVRHKASGNFRVKIVN